MNLKSEIIINNKYSNIFYRSILPELKTKKYSRSNIIINLVKEKLIIKIESSDLNALRASFNSIMRLIITCDKTIKLSD